MLVEKLLISHKSITVDSIKSFLKLICIRNCYVSRKAFN
jgi:hypothetical protein